MKIVITVLAFLICVPMASAKRGSVECAHAKQGNTNVERRYGRLLAQLKKSTQPSSRKSKNKKGHR